MTEARRTWIWLLLTAGCCAVFVVVLAIGSGVVTQAQEEDYTPIRDHEEIIVAQSASPHGDTYDEGKSPNTYCSRCHSPQNWNPAARVGPPPNCVTPTSSRLMRNCALHPR